MEKLLKLLDENARLSDAQLAAMLGTTEAAVKAEIADLENRGVIRAYKAVIDWDKTDREYVTALIELHVTPKPDAGFEAIAETIMQFDEVESISLMSGGYDFSITVTARTFKDVAMFVAKRLSPLESVVSTATHFVLRRYKQNNVIFQGGDRDERGVL
ncbi:MAG: Lrp/AsnC family transcriptional regulator [Clostridia bacterium]|nr:Lrp/AsnC family transcriptional regulator [Clostridia bacterium]